MSLDLHFIDGEATHKEVTTYLVQHHTESKTRTDIKNAGSVVPELALFIYCILLHTVCTKCEGGEDRYTGHRVNIKKLPKNHK